MKRLLQREIYKARFEKAVFVWSAEERTEGKIKESDI